MKKRIVCVFLAVLLAATFVAGCGNDNPGSSTNSAAASSAPAQESTKAPETVYGKVALEKQLDYINYDSAVPIVKPGNNITLTAGIFPNKSSAFADDPAKVWLWDYCRDQLGFDVNVVIMDDEKYSLSFASNNLPDVILGVPVSTDKATQYGVESHQLLAINNYLEGYMPSLSAWFEKNSIWEGTLTAPDGNLYLLPRELSTVGFASALPIRQTWLDILGLQMPKSIDDLTSVLMAFRDNTAKLGVDRVIPAGGGFESTNPMTVILEAFGYQVDPYYAGKEVASGLKPFLRVDDSGNAHYGLPIADDLFAKVLEMQKKWVSEKLVSEDFFTLSYEQMFADVSAGNVGFLNQNDPLTAGPDGQGGWRNLPGLTSQYHSKSQAAAYQPIAPCNLQLPTGKYPEVACRFADLFYNMDYVYIVGRGPIEGDPRTPSYGYPAQIWVENADGKGNPGSVVGDTLAEAYANKHYRPMYTANLGLVPSDESGAAWRSAVSRKTMPVIGMTEKLNTWKERLAKDPVTFAGDAYDISRFENRGYGMPGTYNPVLTVSFFDTASGKKVNELLAVITPYVYEQVARFITGKRPLEEYPAFQSELKQMGLDELNKIYEGQYKDYLAKVK